jgi:hypothetical protein
MLNDPMLLHLPEFTLIDGKFMMHDVGYGGGEICPFHPKEDKLHQGIGYGSSEYFIKNMKNGKSIKFSSLLPHMIQYHSFFEGHVTYRLNPQDVVECLEI